MYYKDRVVDQETFNCYVEKHNLKPQVRAGSWHATNYVQDPDNCKMLSPEEPRGMILELDVDPALIYYINYEGGEE